MFVELPFLEKIIRGGDHAEDARGGDQQVSGGRTEYSPHVARFASGNSEQARQSAGENEKDRHPEHRYFKNVFEELNGVFE